LKCIERDAIKKKLVKIERIKGPRTKMLNFLGLGKSFEGFLIQKKILICKNK
jgi:hypothetical protein